MAELKKSVFLSRPWKSVQIYRVGLGWNLDDYTGFQPKTTPAQRYETLLGLYDALQAYKYGGYIIL